MARAVSLKRIVVTLPGLPGMQYLAMPSTQATSTPHLTGIPVIGDVLFVDTSSGELIEAKREASQNLSPDPCLPG